MTPEQQTLPEKSQSSGSGEPARLGRLELFVLTVLGTWLLWVPVAVLNASEEAGTIPVVLGAFTPSILGVLLTRRYTDANGRREFWRRVRDPRQIGMRWGAVTILFAPTLMALTLVLSALVGIDLPPRANALDTLTDPVALLGFVALMAIGGPIAEELGWRGFALDAAQDWWTPLTVARSGRCGTHRCSSSTSRRRARWALGAPVRQRGQSRSCSSPSSIRRFTTTPDGASSPR